MDNVLAIIPARFASTRFPGKPLALVHGIPMIVRVVQRASKVFSHVCVATDDERICREVAKFGGTAVMTSSEHRSGTDRCLEALDKYSATCGMKFDAVVNIQGDEPFIKIRQLEALAGCFDDPEVRLATIVKPCKSLEEATDPNRPKVVVDKDMNALYFSRSTIPYYRGGELTEEVVAGNRYYIHIGLYGYRTDALRQICSLPEGLLEKTEKLEQLRWLENGLKIRVAESDCMSWSVDTPEDLAHLNSTPLEYLEHE